MSGRPSHNTSLPSRTDPLVSQNDETNVSIYGAAPESREVTPPTPLEIDALGAYGVNIQDSGSISQVITEQQANPKVAIPRLDLPLGSTNGRVSRACHNCRKQKNKCSGHRPSCLRCQETNVYCVYVDGKRERNAKQLTIISSQLKHYESLVRDIYPKIDSELARIVDQALEKISGLSLPSPTAPKVPDETEAPAPMISSVDHTTEDFNGDTSLQARGFVGEHSPMAWLYRLRRQIDQASSDTAGQSERPGQPSLSSCGFFVDEIGLPSTNDSDYLAYPSQVVADELVDRYFQVAHASFPILGKEIFLNQCRLFYSNTPTHPGNKWMALLNMVFAIAARHFELDGHHPRLDHNKHAVYFSRAQRLNQTDCALLDHPNLQQTQAEALISLYMLSIGQINRAWRVCGVAIQSAISMGIHLRSESSSITHVSKETRYRLWWALYVMDSLLCGMTGRMPRMPQEHCTTPLPVPYKEEDFWDEHVARLIVDIQSRDSLMKSLLSYDRSIRSNEQSRYSPPQQPLPEPVLPMPEHQANVSLYLLYSINLSAVMRDAIEILYSPGAGRKSRQDLEMAMMSLNTAADNWFARLPQTYRFTEPRVDKAFARQRTSLAFQYYSTKLVISHPALSYQPRCEGSPNEFYPHMAAICVKAASHMLDLLPNEPSMAWLMSCSPWWTVLHYLTQGTVVLVRQLLTQSQAWAIDWDETLGRVQKALRWFSQCSTTDASFERAWGNFAELLSSQGLDFGVR
ncbi:uncharacterized protein N7515_003605 [Penicillium bovifimosum]|uniref:Zn(2)-C6 fungal-type domain-containing protein n=1 Tax=Penicillium bovifimosum TaxID=126998 RepID=A0A9W9H4Z4_9EURO|nr:uncharacterized protein N7515_003605 [Penicillium bovifimosum]KAJ5138757.1 hypothetical protein N7515_003605 [Penicillium bovifimosum]